MADDSGIDPRYAAQFQRGYDPAAHAPPASSRPAGPVRLSNGPVTKVERVPPPPPLVVAPVTPDAPAPEAQEEPDAVAPRRRPIAEWVLLGVSLLLLAAAVWSFEQQIERSSGGFGPSFEETLAFVLIVTLPGPLFVGGVVGVLLWIALRASSSRGPR